MLGVTGQSRAVGAWLGAQEATVQRPLGCAPQRGGGGWRVVVGVEHQVIPGGLGSASVTGPRPLGGCTGVLPTSKSPLPVRFAVLGAALLCCCPGAGVAGAASVWANSQHRRVGRGRGWLAMPGGQVRP